MSRKPGAIQLVEPEMPFHAIRFGGQFARRQSGGGQAVAEGRGLCACTAEFSVFCIFFYRHVLRLGFLDGRAGAAFHFLQGFWYRFLVDVKVSEVERYVACHRVSIVEAIGRVLDIRLAPAVAGPTKRDAVTGSRDAR